MQPSIWSLEGCDEKRSTVTGRIVRHQLPRLGKICSSANLERHLKSGHTAECRSRCVCPRCVFLGEGMWFEKELWLKEWWSVRADKVSVHYRVYLELSKGHTLTGKGRLSTLIFPVYLSCLMLNSDLFLSAVESQKKLYSSPILHFSVKLPWNNVYCEKRNTNKF